MRNLIHLLLLVLLASTIVIGILLATGKKDQSVQNEKRPDNVMNNTRTFDAELDRYLSENKEKDYATMCTIANEIASAQANLWESCGMKMVTVLTHGEIKLAMAHIASAYYKIGQSRKEELLSLLKSNDVELVRGLLHLLVYTVDLGANGEWQLDKPLGGADLPPYISQIAIAHPDLAIDVARTLGKYRTFARGETATLLRLLISQDMEIVFTVKLALRDVDNELYMKLGLGELDEPLTNEQKTKVERLIMNH